MSLATGMKAILIVLAIATGVSAGLWVFALLFVRYPGWIVAVVIISLALSGACMGFLNAFLRYRGFVKPSKVWLHSPLASLLLGLASCIFAIDVALIVYSPSSQWAMPANATAILIIFVAGRIEQRARRQAQNQM